MRLLQRDHAGRVIEALAPRILCALVLDGEFFRSASVSRGTRKLLRGFCRKLEKERDAAALVRVALGTGGLRAATSCDFVQPGLARVGLSSEGSSSAASAAIDEALACVERAAADFRSQGEEVSASYLIVLTRNASIGSEQRGGTTILSFSDSSFAGAAGFLDRCAQLLLEEIDGGAV